MADKTAERRFACVKPHLWGVVIGGIAMMMGFWYFDWYSAGGAERMAKERVVDALVPVCVENFGRQPDAAAKLAQLKAAASYERRSFVEKGGWATVRGGTPNDAVAQACVDKLVATP